MSNGLSVSGVVNVEIVMSPTAAPARDFGNFLIIGPSDVIDASERVRYYSSLNDVANDFGVDSSEYDATRIFFSQNPKPRSIYIGRMVAEASSAVLRGGILTEDQKAIANFTSITDGSFKINVDGTNKTVKTLDFSAQTDINGVASVVNTAVSAFGSCVFNGDRFIIKSKSTGEAATIGYAEKATDGADVSMLLALTVDLANVPTNGRKEETALECVKECTNASGAWYGCTFAHVLSDEEHIKVAEFIEATEPRRIYGITSSDTKLIDPTVENDLASKLKKLKLSRTMVQYSTKSKYAVASVFGRMSTVKFLATESTITLKFKQLPGVEYEVLRSDQAKALKDKNVNVFVLYDNETSILQEGVMSNGYFIDEVHGLDWLQNFVQNNVWNLMYQSKTKIPQTEKGVTRIINKVTESFEQAVRNGLVAPGRWTSDGFGNLEEGDMLPTGYYIYSIPIEDQPQSEREKRVSPLIQTAIKLAGAIHFVDVVINVNR